MNGKQPSERLCSNVGCARKARKHGDDCRQCYRAAWMRRKRAQDSFEKSHISLDEATFQLNRRMYDEWFHNQF